MIGTTTLVIIILLVLLILAVPAWPYSRTFGPAPASVLGAVLLVVLILWLAGKL